MLQSFDPEIIPDNEAIYGPGHPFISPADIHPESAFLNDSFVDSKNDFYQGVFLTKQFGRPNEQKQSGIVVNISLDECGE
jgi:hypothetical protein